MKKERSTPSVSLVLGLLALAVLLAQCGEAPLGVPTPAETLPPGKATAPPAETVAYAPTETATPSPRGTPSPLPTPFVLQVTGVNEVALPVKEFVLEGLYGDLAVGITPGENNQVWLVDLSTGQWRRLDRSTDAKYRTLPCISGRWVVWCEGVDTSEGQYVQYLVAYDLELNREFRLSAIKGLYNVAPKLWGDILVWNERRDFDNGLDIFARNLATGQEWVVATGSHDQLFPQISSQWIIYLDRENGRLDNPYLNLRAQYLPTGEDFLIGQVPNPPDSSAGTYQAIAGHQVVWIKYQPDPVSQLHVFDLETRTDQPLILSDGRQIYKFLDLFGDHALFKNGRIYSLESGAVLGTLDLSAVRGMVYRVYASGNRVVLGTGEEGAGGKTFSRLYTLQLGR